MLGEKELMTYDCRDRASTVVLIKAMSDCAIHVELAVND
jgi:hypothetical protein